MRLLLLFALVACSKDPPADHRADPPTPPPGPQRIDAAVAPSPRDATQIADEPDAMPTPHVDAGPVDYSQLTTVEWPTAMEVEMVERNGPVAKGTAEMTYPKFRIRPKQLADELAAKLAADTSFGKDPSDHGTYTFQCTLVTTSRIAVIVRCGKMWDTSGDCVNCGGAPAGPHPQQYAYWLQPGLPPLTLDQIAPGIDIAAMIATANKLDEDGCRMASCELSPQHWSITTEGIALEPGEYCSGCAEKFPKIPLADLKPTHPWAVKWLAWIQQRAAAGETLVKYTR